MVERDRVDVGDLTLVAYASSSDPMAACTGARVVMFGTSSPLTLAQLRELGLAALAFYNGNWVELTDAERERRGQLTLLAEVARG